MNTKTKISKWALAGVAAVTLAAGALGLAVKAGQTPTEQPPATLEAIATATPTVTAAATATPEPTIDLSYYTPVAPESTPTQTAPQATPTQQPIIPTVTPRPVPTATQYYPTPQPTEIPESTATPFPTLIPTQAPTPAATPTPTSLPGIESLISEQLIAKYAANWQTKQLITPELLAQIDSVNKTLYYRFTGNTFEASRFQTRLLTQEEYRTLEGKPGGTIPNSEGTIGVMSDGTINVYARSHIGEKIEPIEILRVLVRETANAEVDKRQSGNPFRIDTLSYEKDKKLEEVARKYNLGDINDLYIAGIERESLQTLYQAAVFHYLKESGAIKYPGLTDGGKAIDDTIAAIINRKKISDNFFYQATLVDWNRALKQADTKATLQEKGEITWQQSIGLFDTYSGWIPTQEEWERRIVEIVTAVRTAPQYAQQIKDACKLSQRPLRDIYFP